MCNSGVVVVNYVSWLDIFILNVLQWIYFVLKFEVVGWSGIGMFVKVIGMVFIVCEWCEVKLQ